MLDVRRKEMMIQRIDAKAKRPMLVTSPEFGSPAFSENAKMQLGLALEALNNIDVSKPANDVNNIREIKLACQNIQLVILRNEGCLESWINYQFSRFNVSDYSTWPETLNMGLIEIRSSSAETYAAFVKLWLIYWICGDFIVTGSLLDNKEDSSGVNFFKFPKKMCDRILEVSSLQAPTTIFLTADLLV